MNGHDVVMAVVTVVSSVNLVVVVTLAFRWGRWSGIVDTRLDNIEHTLKGEA